MTMASEPLAIVCPGETRAWGVPVAVYRLYEAGMVDLYSAAVITRDGTRRISIHGTDDFTPREAAAECCQRGEGMTRDEGDPDAMLSHCGASSMHHPEGYFLPTCMEARAGERDRSRWNVGHLRLRSRIWIRALTHRNRRWGAHV